MRYIRMYLGGEGGEPGLTLYEIDPEGRVHRQVQVHAQGSRFSPEDILMRRSVNVDYMAMHPAAEEIDASDFEHLWTEVDDCRNFKSRLPDPTRAWQGWVDQGNGVRELCWKPEEAPSDGWHRVPGFVHLYVRGDETTAWSTQADLFLERPIHWQSVEPQAAA